MKQFKSMHYITFMAMALMLGTCMCYAAQKAVIKKGIEVGARRVAKNTILNQSTLRFPTSSNLPAEFLTVTKGRTIRFSKNASKELSKSSDNSGTFGKIVRDNFGGKLSPRGRLALQKEIQEFLSYGENFTLSNALMRDLRTGKNPSVKYILDRQRILRANIFAKNPSLLCSSPNNLETLLSRTYKIPMSPHIKYLFRSVPFALTAPKDSASKLAENAKPSIDKLMLVDAENFITGAENMYAKSANPELTDIENISPSETSETDVLLEEGNNIDFLAPELPGKIIEPNFGSIELRNTFKASTEIAFPESSYTIADAPPAYIPVVSGNLPQHTENRTAIILPSSEYPIIKQSTEAPRASLEYGNTEAESPENQQKAAGIIMSKITSNKNTGVVRGRTTEPAEYPRTMSILPIYPITRLATTEAPNVPYTIDATPAASEYSGTVKHRERSEYPIIKQSTEASRASLEYGNTGAESPENQQKAAGIIMSKITSNKNTGVVRGRTTEPAEYPRTMSILPISEYPITRLATTEAPNVPYTIDATPAASEHQSFVVEPQRTAEFLQKKKIHSTSTVAPLYGNTTNVLNTTSRPGIRTGIIKHPDNITYHNTVPTKTEVPFFREYGTATMPAAIYRGSLVPHVHSPTITQVHRNAATEIANIQNLAHPDSQDVIVVNPASPTNLAPEINTNMTNLHSSKLQPVPNPIENIVHEPTPLLQESLIITEGRTAEVSLQNGLKKSAIRVPVKTMLERHEPAYVKNQSEIIKVAPKEEQQKQSKNNNEAQEKPNVTARETVEKLVGPSLDHATIYEDSQPQQEINSEPAPHKTLSPIPGGSGTYHPEEADNRRSMPKEPKKIIEPKKEAQPAAQPVTKEVTPSVPSAESARTDDMPTENNHLLQPEEADHNDQNGATQDRDDTKEDADEKDVKKNHKANAVEKSPDGVSPELSASADEGSAKPGYNASSPTSEPMRGQDGDATAILLLPSNTTHGASTPIHSNEVTPSKYPLPLGPDRPPEKPILVVANPIETCDTISNTNLLHGPELDEKPISEETQNSSGWLAYATKIAAYALGIISALCGALNSRRCHNVIKHCLAQISNIWR